MSRSAEAAGFGPARWDGRRGRIDVWYATFTGGWLHHETVAPTDDRPPYAHGWAATFPDDGPPTVARFGPAPVARDGGDWFRCGPVSVGPGRMVGRAGDLDWDLTFADDGPPLLTFPAFAWRRDVLPGAQVVPWPRATIRGTFAGRPVDAVGAVARIHGHGNAQRWGWLHADLGAGAVLEVVTATPRRRGLRHLPALAQVQLRRPGRRDWPSRPLLASFRTRTQFVERGFTVTGRGLRVEVDLPADRTVRLTYVDPDGATATCTNSERADATVVVGTDRWELRGTAHAEVGDRRSVA